MAAIRVSDMPQEVLVPVNFSFPDAAGNSATLVFGRHVVVIEN